MKYKSLTFGAVLWDVINGKEFLGGAPYNLAAHLRQLGFDSNLVSGIGEDKRGLRIFNLLKSQGMDVELIQIVKGYKTGNVDVQLNENGIPSYTISADTAFDHTSYSDYLDRILKNDKFDLFCYGSFDQRSEHNRKTLKIIQERIDSRVKFFDVNLRKPFFSKNIIEESLHYADIVKINEEELLGLSEMFYGKSLKESDFFNYFSNDFDIKMIIETKGKKGCTVWDDRRVFNTPIPRIEMEVVVDTVGAGDAFCAGFLWSYCHGLSPVKCSQNGNLLGSYVAQSSGAVPPLNSVMKRIFPN